MKLEFKNVTKQYGEVKDAYKRQNLLCSNWDTDHMEKLDYNGMYEYLYAMKHQKAFDAERCE